MTHREHKGLRAFEALLNITWAGQNGDLADAVPFDATDREIKHMALEAIRTGAVPGIRADRLADLDDFMVDRFRATAEVPYNRLFVRPKTPFGAA